MPLPIPTQHRILEAVAVLLTAVGKFIFMDWLKVPRPFIFTVGTLWIAYVLIRWKDDPSILAYWGFRKDNFVFLSRRLALPALTVVIACIIIGYVRGTLIISWHILPLFILYPLWGTIQQYLCMALVAGNLRDMQLNKLIAVLITATLFAAMHLPNIFLAGGTFLLALIYGFIYLKEKNLFVLGILHGWLGAVFYYTVVGMDQWEKIFGNI